MRLRFAVVAAALALVSAACTYDFDRFESQPDAAAPAAATDAGAPDAADAND